MKLLPLGMQTKIAQIHKQAHPNTTRSMHLSPSPRLPMPMRPALPANARLENYLSSEFTPSSPQTPIPISNTAAPQPPPASPQASVSQPCSPAAPSVPAGRRSPSGTIPLMRRLRSVALVSFRFAQYAQDCRLSAHIGASCPRA